MRSSKTSMKRAIKSIETLTFRCEVIQSDIDEGECRQANRCMHKLAIARALSALLKCSISDLKVRVAADGIRFHWRGYRWHALLPKKAKMTLIAFDDPKRCHLVKPHSYTVTAMKMTKIVPFTRERQEQVNAARRARIDAGFPDKPYGHSLRERLIGLQ